LLFEKRHRKLDPASYFILLYVSYMSVLIAPFDWAFRTKSDMPLYFFSVMWIMIGASFPVAIASFMIRGLYPVSLLDFPSFSASYFSTIVILVTVIAYLRLSKMGFYHSLSVITLSLANFGVGALSFIGVVNLDEAVASLGPGIGVLISSLSLTLLAASFVDIAVSFMIYDEEKKISLMKYVLKVIEKIGSASYGNLEEEIDTPEVALSEAISTLLDRGEITVKVEEGKDYFIIDKEYQGESIRD
jgi:hypothetical protein